MPKAGISIPTRCISALTVFRQPKKNVVGISGHRHLHGRTSGQDAQRSRRTRFGQGNPGHFHQRPRIPLGRTSLAKGTSRRVPVLDHSLGNKFIDRGIGGHVSHGLRDRRFANSSSVQGKSLLPIIAKSMVRNSALSFVKQELRCAPNAGPKEHADGSEELYDMAKDPKQFVNLAKSSK